MKVTKRKVFVLEFWTYSMFGQINKFISIYHIPYTIYQFIYSLVKMNYTLYVV